MDIPVAARFRAIITGPLSTSPGTSDRQQSVYEPRSGVRFQETPTKRKKADDDAGASIPKKIVRRTSEDEGGSAREPTISYKDREALLKALHECFKQGPHVDFHGTYEITDPGSNHKARIKSMAMEIWKVTGYRFTVKDHPQFSNGHKTRFWCSQDEAHRSKSSRAARKAQGDLYKPRQSSSGESLAKNRFPCRSRLLISSRDSGTPGHPIVTVRIHHHVAHEPYVDLNLPPEVAHDVYWISKLGARPIANRSDGMTNPPRLVHAIQRNDEHALPEEDSPQRQEIFNNSPELPEDDFSAIHSRATILTRDHDPPPPSSHPSTPQTPTLAVQNAEYHRRMHTHIRNLREFCDGLEFNVQFNDYRMLEALEREGAQFLGFVGDCLKKEGRLVSTNQDVVPHTSTHPAHSHLRNGVAPHADQPVVASMQMQQPFEANPGVNPGALAR